MIGTRVNTCTIIAESIVDIVMNWGIKEKYKDTLYMCLGTVAAQTEGLQDTEHADYTTRTRSVVSDKKHQQ